LLLFYVLFVIFSFLELDYRKSCGKMEAEGSSMKKIIMFLLIIIAACAAYAKVSPNQGTTIKQLNATGLKAPATQKVAVLPFWDFSGEQTKGRSAAIATYLFMQREGYQIVPLWDAEKAYLADKDLEPGDPLRKQDAIRIGKALGADLVCYGELREVQQKTKYNLWWGNRPRAEGSIKVSIIATDDGGTIFWGVRSDEASGQFRTSETSRERHAICLITNHLLEPICKCLPENHIHNPSGRVTENDILKLEKQWDDILKNSPKEK